MKTIKIIWPNYYKDVITFKSYNNSWINQSSSSSSVDMTIYIDQLQIPNNAIVLLVEPYSIHPRQYDYVKSIAHNLKAILSYDSDYFGSLSNFVQIPPPFGSWVNEQERGIFQKSKNISFIASTKNFCGEHDFRQKTVAILHDKVDVFGRGRKNEISRKIEALRDYRFSICMENYIADLYYTEKVLDCFLSGTIPIFWGTRSIVKIFDVNGIVFLDDILTNKININDLNENYYNFKLDFVRKNFEIANNLKNSVPNSIDFYLKTLKG